MTACAGLTLTVVARAAFPRSRGGLDMRTTSGLRRRRGVVVVCGGVWREEEDREIPSRRAGASTDSEKARR